MCLIWNLKPVRASRLASDLGKTNAFAMWIGSTESKTFFHCEERSCTRKSLTFVATASCFTLSFYSIIVGDKKLKKNLSFPPFLPPSLSPLPPFSLFSPCPSLSPPPPRSQGEGCPQSRSRPRPGCVSSGRSVSKLHHRWTGL